MSAPIGVERRQHAAAGAQYLVGMLDDGAVGPRLVDETEQLGKGIFGPCDAVSPDKCGKGGCGAAAGAGMAMYEEPPRRGRERLLDEGQHDRDIALLRPGDSAGL